MKALDYCFDNLGYRIKYQPKKKGYEPRGSRMEKKGNPYELIKPTDMTVMERKYERGPKYLYLFS